MQIPSFHDGTFDGLRIRADKRIQLYLSTGQRESFVLVLDGVQALVLNDIKQGNIILDLVIREGAKITKNDVTQVYGLNDDSVTMNKLETAVNGGFQILEINPSYGAEGLILFKTWSLAPSTD
jgi:hypothetical protein